MRPITITTKITTRENDSFKRYLGDISKIKQFENADDEHECALLAFNGDLKAKDELIKRNLRFVISVAKQYVREGVTLEDLVNEGNIGIAIAADRFDPTKGYKFISYAVWYIRREILAFLSNNSRTIRLPTNRVIGLQTYKERLSKLEQILEHTPSNYDMVKHYDDYTIEDVELLSILSQDNVDSLDRPIDSGESVMVSDMVVDYSLGRTDKLLSESDSKVNMNRMFSVLSVPERIILTMLFGLEDGETKTLEQVGNHFNISKEMVRQKRNKALKKIKVKCGNLNI